MIQFTKLYSTTVQLYHWTTLQLQGQGGVNPDVAPPDQRPDSFVQLKTAHLYISTTVQL